MDTEIRLKHVEDKLEHMEQRIEQCNERVEEKITDMKQCMESHFRESDLIREKVLRHEAKLENGWASRVETAVNKLEKTVLLLEAKLENLIVSLESKSKNKRQVWLDIGFGIGLLSTFIGVMYTLMRISQLGG
jgi:hypothetical protein